ncbi:protein-disulfide reductase DsbD family protein [Parvularcula sp. LCG005]|uniref:protein-disulfide reductase DsbD family protein n=1 Tax=Parvularcula sp. LCG005 TaxID=3078805 RepID=UPI00294353C5|nr:thioredoxin family protein [Parvularcula sp. LCG005]WOI53950.1 protein-disulfide reductase DsbD family protein [Parvularcula sp. LCG005]
MRLNSVLTLLMLALCWLVPAAAQVGPPVKTGHASTRLATQYEAVQPGQTITLGIVQELEDHWHVYWQNPGDSGLPLDLRWTLPDGVSAGPARYPLPHRLPLGPLVNYGHEDEPVFLVDLTVDDTVAAGTSIPIEVAATWLICKDICVPEDATLRMSLPVREGAAKPTRFAGRIEDALAAQPTPAPFGATYYDTPKGPVLALDGLPRGPTEFFPYAPSVIEPSGEVLTIRDGGVDYFQFVAGFAYQAQQPERLSGVIVIEEGGDRVGYTIAAPRTEPNSDLPFLGEGATGAARTDDPKAPANAPVVPTKTPLLPVTLLLAFVGGLILNVMPCVFPIVLLKAAGFAALGQEQQGKVRAHGLLYTAGVLVTFLGMAVVLMLLRAGGEQLGWGFQLQSPVAVALFALAIFLIGLNLAGLFDVGTSVQGLGAGLADRRGGAGAFFTGLLAVAVAAPCIGPFLGGAIGFALTSAGMLSGVLIFMAIGLGLAFPYLLLSFFPGFARRMPRPGPWLVTLRQLFSFAMFATLVWLVWVLSVQLGSTGVLLIGISLVLAALAAWAFGRSQGRDGLVLRIVAAAALVLALIPVWSMASIAPVSAPVSEDESTIAYSEPALSDLLAQDRAVFIDFTAAWCITCQVNKLTVLQRDDVQAAFRRHDVAFMVADWTSRDPEITEALEKYGRAGVPLYLYYEPGAETAKILPQTLSVEGILALFGEDEGETS